MENIQKVETPTPDELKAEEEAMVEVKEDEVRETIISEYGFNEEDDVEKIDKLVENEIKHKKNLSTAIKQKIKYRDNPPKPEEPEVKPKKEEPSNKSAEEIIREQFEQRDLDDLDYSDELKDEIKRVSKFQEVSIKKALQDPYIVSKIEAHKETVETEEAAISRTNKTGGKGTYSVDKSPEVDMDTEEGRKEWDEYLEWLAKQPGYTAQDSQL